MVDDLENFFNATLGLLAGLAWRSAAPPDAIASWKGQALALRDHLAALWRAEGDWHVLEERCRHTGTLFAGLLLSLVVWRKDALAVPERCPVCRKRIKTRWLSRTPATTCGRVPLWRREASCRRKYYPAQYPADIALGLPAHDRVSPLLAEWTTRLGASLPYLAVEKLVNQWVGQPVISAEGAHDLVARVGAALGEIPAVPPATSPDNLPERMVVDADAALVALHRTARVKETDRHFELWAIRTYERHERVYGDAHLYRHLAFAGGCSRAGDDVPGIAHALVAQRFPAAIPERTVYVRGDGGQAIDTIASRFPKQRRLLDLYHTLVKVTERVREAFPDTGFEVRRAHDDRLSDLLRAGDGPGLVAACHELKAQGGLAEPLDRLAKHIRKHIDHLWYPEAKELGLSVGTGISEKDVDLLLDRRFELRGMSWSPKGAQNALRIRITLFNDTPESLRQATK